MSLTKHQALEMFESDDLIGIGMEADAVRRKLHPEGTVTYIIDRNINYTNFCTEYCTFCAFYRPLKGPAAKEGYILDFDTIYDKIRETVELGGTGVLMQGGLHPDLKIDWHEKMLRGIKERFPQSSSALLLRVRDHRHRRIQQPEHSRHHPPPARCRARFHPRRRRRNSRRRSPLQNRPPEMPHRRLDQRPPHRPPDRHAHHRDHDVRRRRKLRKPRQPLPATLRSAGRNRRLYRLHPLELPAHNTALGGRHWDEATAVEYLKTLAISRLYLSNFLNVQSSWVTQGLKVCQMGLRFGGNDVGSVMLEENVVRAAGVTNCTTEEELRRIIRDAGFRPAQRDTLYRQYFLN